MLVLRRRIGEEIVIDGHIRVQVVEIHQGKVRLGITAPESVAVLRREILDRLAREQEAAVAAPVATT